MANTRREMLEALKAVLVSHPEAGAVDLERLRITDQAVMEAPDGVSPLSDALLDACFPRADVTAEYVHYSNFQTLQSVAATGQWRLYWVFRRLFDDEYRPFCEDHDLTGYLAVDAATGRPQFEGMTQDLFYTSLKPRGVLCSTP